MLQGLIIKKVIDIVLKKIMEKHKLDKLQKYVEEDNELDKQMKQVQKTMNKYGKVIENLEKTIAVLNKNSHSPIFSSKDLGKLEKRLNKLEKEK
jgi:predicted RNase H-like nuclease (RuvC/YqgF family)